MLESAFEKFKNIGDFLYPDQRSIYNHIGKEIKGEYAIDVGCGIGIGSNILSCHGAKVVGVDVVDLNVKCATNLYPNMNFFQWDIRRGPCDPSVDNVVCIEVIEHIVKPELAIKNLIDSAKKCVYISSPNRNSPTLGQDHPINQYHVKEYSTHEMLEMLPEGVEILNPISFEVLESDTVVTPVVYKLVKNNA
jgi:2-polyprenyl-3-methyl-5-hydroxy-6-metoxy-1,4-benzoquinol methylase